MKLKEFDQLVEKSHNLKKEYEILWAEHCSIQRLLSGEYTAQKDTYSEKYALSMIYISDLHLIDQMRKSLTLFPVETKGHYWENVLLEPTPEVLSRLEAIEERLGEITSELDSDV